MVELGNEKLLDNVKLNSEIVTLLEKNALNVTCDFVLIELGMGSQIVVNLFWKMWGDNWCTWMYGEPR